LADVPAWKPFVSTGGDEVSHPPSGYVWWSGGLRNAAGLGIGPIDYHMIVPPAIGSRVKIVFNEFGPGEVMGYFVEHGFLGLYVKVDKLPAWRVEQDKREAGELGLGASPGNPHRWVMVFGIEVEGEEA
jgi:hypothetical protein